MMSNAYTVDDPVAFAKKAVVATNSKALRDLLDSLPIVGEHDYEFDAGDPQQGWRDGYLHWYPVGRDKGNAGRIKLAGSPENPLAERLVNAMEALIELERQRELIAQPGTPEPGSPREAVQRYFDLPPLHLLPKWQQQIRGRKAFDHARDLARRIHLRLVRSTRPVEYAVLIDDDGIGMVAERIHSTLLSLGRSDKSDKQYMIGVFGQGGSSAYAASEISWLLSRRAPDLLGGNPSGVGWTAVKRITVKRLVYWAYLAAASDGSVLSLPSSAGDAIDLKHGTRFCHLNYNFGRTEPAATLYQGLNHLLFNPVLPYELITGPERAPDPMWGNGYRLSNIKAEKKALDKSFDPQTVEKKADS